MTDSTYIKLDQFLKLQNFVQSGGEAKVLIQTGEVLVNGEIDTRRGRKLVTGDRVEVQGQSAIVDLAALTPSALPDLPDLAPLDLE